MTGEMPCSWRAVHDSHNGPFVREPGRWGFLPSHKTDPERSHQCRASKPTVCWWTATTRSLSRFAPARRPHARQRFTLERLEERAMLSTISLAVTTLLDDPITPIPGQTTLRDAINTADGGATTIQYVIKFAVKGTIDLTSALPDLSNNIDIKGPGASNLTVQRDSSAPDIPIFSVRNGGGASVNISGVTITGGYNTLSWGGGIDNFGGALTVINDIFTNNYSEVGGGLTNGASSNGETGTATVIDCTFSNNSAFDGGGISNIEGSTITIIGSTFANNSAGAYSGGFYNEGVATVIGSTFTNNSADSGGGIFAQIGTTTVIGSIFVNNSAEYGGAIDNGLSQQQIQTLTVIGSIFINNSASFDGGAIYNYGTSAATVTDSIFANNSAIDGGGIYNYSGGTVTVRNSIFAFNIATDGGGIYNLGTLTNTRNLFFDNTGGDTN